MALSRRQFLILSTLSGLGVTALGTNFPSKSEERQAQQPSLRFVAIADSGTGARGQYLVAQAMYKYYQENPYPLVIMAGDNIYNNGEIEKINLVFERPYQPFLAKGVKFYACLGNHDIRTENGEPQVNYPGFNMGGRYYTFRHDLAQYFALDTNHNADWENQLTWLETELSQSDAPWKIVFGHHQLYSSGHYGINQVLVPKLTPLFKKYGVQLYINGHDHHYERTQSIDGTTYLICGAAAGVRPVGVSDWTAHSASRLSFASFDLYPDEMIVQGIATDGTIFDRGKVLREADKVTV